MKYGLRSGDKCNQKELQSFKTTVIQWLKDNNINIEKLKLRCQRNYGGNIGVFLYSQDFLNAKTSIRKLGDGRYYRGKFSKLYNMYTYFYRTEWEEFLKDEDSQNFALIEIKKFS